MKTIATIVGAIVISLFIFDNPLKEILKEPEGCCPTVQDHINTPADTIPGRAWLDSSSWSDYRYEITEGVMIRDTFHIDKIFADSIGEYSIDIVVPEEFILCFIAD